MLITRPRYKYIKCISNKVSLESNPPLKEPTLPREKFYHRKIQDKDSKVHMNWKTLVTNTNLSPNRMLSFAL